MNSSYAEDNQTSVIGDLDFKGHILERRKSIMMGRHNLWNKKSLNPICPNYVVQSEGVP